MPRAYCIERSEERRVDVSCLDRADAARDKAHSDNDIVRHQDQEFRVVSRLDRLRRQIQRHFASSAPESGGPFRPGSFCLFVCLNSRNGHQCTSTSFAQTA